MLTASQTIGVAPLRVESTLQSDSVVSLVNREDKPLRFITCGSVDDGKSTLLGRLLWDTKSVPEDQAGAVEDADGTVQHLGLANLVDGLQAEREQGITIDVAYRYFSTDKRSFIVADTPGHEQYTRNMATGASTADLAVILVDARAGILEQTRRHAAIVSRMGISQVVLAVNKIDLVEDKQSCFNGIVAQFNALVAKLDFVSVKSVPVSALLGINVVKKIPGELNWYTGPSLLELLEKAPVDTALDTGFRMPVQLVCRPDESFRGYQGTLSGGVVKVGDEVRVLPSGVSAKVSRIVTFDGDVNAAVSGAAVTLTLDRPVDVSRGDMLTSIDAAPTVAREFVANLVLLDDRGIDPSKTYWLKSETQKIKAKIKLKHTYDLQNFDWVSGGQMVSNTIAQVEVSLQQDGVFDAFKQNRRSGSFILIDPDTKNTVAGGMINEAVSKENDAAKDESVITFSMSKSLAKEILKLKQVSEHMSEITIRETTHIDPKSFN